MSLPRTSHASSQAGSQELTQQREEEKAMSASATAVQIDLASTPHIPDQDQRTSGQHQISSRQVSKPDRAVTPQTVEVLARLLTQVIEAAVTAGRLRDVQYPSARLIAPSPKQQKQLTEDIVLTSPTALAMSAASSLAAVDSVQLAEEFAHTLQQRCGAAYISICTKAATAPAALVQHRMPAWALDAPLIIGLAATVLAQASCTLVMPYALLCMANMTLSPCN